MSLQLNDEQRLQRIKNLLEQRDRHVDPETKEIDYIMYDQFIFSLNDEGHIDWMYELLEKNKRGKEV